MLSLRTLTLSTLCALTSLACDTPPPAQQTPPPAAQKPEPEPAAPKPDDPEAHLHYVRALEYESSGRLVEARAEVDQALAAGAGRDAKVLAAKLAILRNDLDAAAGLLTPLAADSSDVLVHYNLGLIAQQRNQYNAARSAYLAAVKADPSYAPARFNLAVLAWDAGVHEEAQHHARKFFELSPDDPRAAELRTRVNLDASGAPLPAAPATPGATGLRNPFDKRDPTKASDAKPDRPLDPFAKPTRPPNPGKAEPLAPRNPFEKK